MMRILKYVVLDILKNKMVIVYALMLAMFSWSAFSLEDNAAKGLLSVLNIVLLTVPLVSVLFATIYVYNSNEFIEQLVSHPVKRSKIWKALFTGLSLSMVAAYWMGAGIPLLLYARSVRYLGHLLPVHSLSPGRYTEPVRCHRSTVLGGGAAL